MGGHGMDATYPDALVHSLIQNVYRAAADSDRWPDLLHRLRETIDAANANLSIVDRGQPACSISASVGWDPADIAEYQHRYVHIDPFVAASSTLDVKPGFIGLVQDLISDDDLARTPFYQEFGARAGYIGGIVCVVFTERNILGVVAANRKPGHHFGRGEVELFRVLYPHLRTAFQIHRELRDELQVGTAALATLDRVRTPVFVCDASSRVVHMNRAAVGMEGWTAGGMLVGPENGHRARLRHAISTVAMTIGDVLDADRSRSVRLGSAQASVTAIVSPVRHRHALDVTRPLVAVSVVTAPQFTLGDAVQLRGVYGLTPAESRLALKLLAGRTLRAAANELGVSRETMRTHLRHLFEKTQTRRQADLIRALLMTLLY